MDTQQSLMALGFTALEADIYTALLSSTSLTGYRIAQVLGKPVANVYKALESLQGKGAVIVDSSGSKFCRAIPPAELLASLEQKFAQEIERAETSLAKITPSKTDERTYELLTRDQVLSRARTMLESCKEVALLDLFPEPAKLLAEEMQTAADRGVIVAAMLYKPESLRGVHVFVKSKGESVRKRWPGEWLNLVVDAKEHLLSFLSMNGKDVLQAVWSASPYLSWIYHGGLGAEMMAIAFISAVEKKATHKDLLAIMKQFEEIKALQAPGYQELLRKFGGDRIAGSKRKVI